jgi:uncharacterized membrane protein
MPDIQDASDEGGEERSREQPQASKPGQEPVWSFRGYQLKAGDFTTAMVHFFRAEISRANVWRQRLDTTTNWAVITTGAAMLVPPFHPSADRAESLAENLLHPDFPISMWEALGRRLRRNYLWIYLILGIAWLAKNFLFPRTVTSPVEFFSNAAIGVISGWVILLIGVIFYAILFGVGLLTSNLHQATGEVLPRYLDDLRSVPMMDGEHTSAEREKPWYRLSRRRQQLVAFIITSQAEKTGKLILLEMYRGVTALHGKGLYSGRESDVLLCALTATVVNQLKSLVYRMDPQAFVIVTPAREVLGKGFMPLQAENVG